MLDFVRNKQKSIIIKLAFAIIILSFVIGYAMLTSPGGSDDGDQSTAAATVNDKAISYDDFQQAYGNLYQLYQNIYQNQFTPALEKQLKLADKTINSLIDQVLLQDEAEKLQLEVSGKELVDSIAGIEAFQVNGVFNKERYLQVLAYQRLNSDQFEAMQRNELLINKVRERIVSGVTVSDAEIEEEFRKNNEKINLNFVSLAPQTFESKVKVTDEALEAFFKEQQEIFRIPDMIALRYLQFEPERYLEQVTFDDAELEKYYRRHLDQFEILERVKASHILIKVDEKMDEATRAKKRAFAEKLLEEARAGKDFAELARRNSDDKESAVQGGSLGTFTRGSMVKPFEEAAFNLKPGEISDLVQTTFGYHIIKVEEHIEPGIRSLADATDEVKEGVRAEKARQLAFEKAMDAYNINRKTGDLDAAASANKLGIKETGPFARDGYIDGIGRNEDVIKAAFLLDDKALARPVTTDNGVILFGIKERIPSHIPQFTEVKDMVTAAYRTVEAGKLAVAAVKELVDGMQGGASLAQLAGKAGYKVEETGEFTRSYSPFVPRLGSSEDLFKAAFAMGEGQTAINQFFEIQNRFVAAEIKQRTPADLKQLDNAKQDDLRKALMARKQNETLEKRLAELRGAATITLSARIQDLLSKEK